jgi:RNA binding exosome subunit
LALEAVIEREKRLEAVTKREKRLEAENFFYIRLEIFYLYLGFVRVF